MQQIVRSGKGDGNIIGGETFEHATLVSAAFDEHRPGAAQLALVKGCFFGIAQLPELGNSIFLDPFCHLLVKAGSLGAGSDGVGEDMQVGEVKRLQKGLAGGKMGLGFAGKANEDINADGRIGQILVAESDDLVGTGRCCSAGSSGREFRHGRFATEYADAAGYSCRFCIRARRAVSISRGSRELMR